MVFKGGPYPLLPRGSFMTYMESNEPELNRTALIMPRRAVKKAVNHVVLGLVVAAAVSSRMP